VVDESLFDICSVKLGEQISFILAKPEEKVKECLRSFKEGSKKFEIFLKFGPVISDCDNKKEIIQQSKQFQLFASFKIVICTSFAEVHL